MLSSHSTHFVRRATGVAVLALAALCAAFALAACGSSDSSSSGGSKEASKISAASGSDPAVVALVPDAIKKRGYLSVAGPDASPPLSSVAGSGKAEGMDPALAAAVAQVMGLKVRYAAVPFDSELPGLAAGKYDIAMGEFYITPERLKTADFVSAWRTFSAFLTKKDNSYAPKGVSDLCGKRIGVLKGSAEEASLEAASKTCSPKITISAFPDQNASFLALSSGRVDAVTTGRELLALAVKKSPNFKVSGGFGGGPTSVAVARTAYSAQMLTAVQKAYERLMENGTYGQILKQWDTDFGAVKSVTVYTKDSKTPDYS